MQRCAALCPFALTIVLSSVPCRAASAPVAVLDKGTYWRYALAWKTETVRRKDGRLEGLPGRKGRPAVVAAYGLPPATWIRPDFDDSTWDRARGRVGASWAMGLMCLRARFAVRDPARAAGLKLSLSFIGGAVVYVNGRELTRAGLPRGKVGLTDEAEPLPREAFVDPDGDLYRNAWGDPQRYKDRLRARLRHISGVEIPTRMLRRGVNVVAIQLHRAPADELLLTAKPKRWKAERWRGRGYYWWSRLRFDGAALTAPAGLTAVVPNTARPAALQVWNRPIIKRVYAGEYGDPNEPLRPVRLAGPRNAVLSGQVVVGAPKPLAGLAAKAGDLAGKAGTIPATAVELRFLRPDGDRRGSFGSLVPEPPAKPLAVQPVWIRVRVPKEAKPGAYAGKVAIMAHGATVDVPVQVRVCGWTLPAPQRFTSHVGLIQSPETLSMKYNVPMWSDKHWALIDRSFQLMGEVGCKVVHVPVIRHTHFGNEHSRVRWIRDGRGGYTYDFSLVEKYLDTAIRRLGRVPVVNFYCWEMYTGAKYLNHKARGGGKGMQFTILDPKTGQLEAAEGPRWGDPKVRTFWKPVFEGLRGILKTRGLEASFMLGIAGDSRPTKQAGEDLKAAAPWAKFVVHSHATASNIWGIPVGYLADVWGAPSAPDPARKRLYGWRSSFRRTTFPRAGSNTVGAMRPSTPLAMWYVSLEAMQTAGLHGFGRMGADFWAVRTSKTHRGGRTLFARFPESSWAQLSAMNSSHFVLAPGPGGAVPTVRFEMIRSAQQLAEARIFTERALTDPAKKAKLGAGLAARAQTLLDARVRANIRAKMGWHWFLGSGWQARDEGLFALAAEVAGALKEE